MLGQYGQWKKYSTKSEEKENDVGRYRRSYPPSEPDSLWSSLAPSLVNLVRRNVAPGSEMSSKLGRVDPYAAAKVEYGEASCPRLAIEGRLIDSEKLGTLPDTHCGSTFVKNGKNIVNGHCSPSLGTSRRLVLT